MGALIPLIITGATWLGRIGIAFFAYNEIKKAFSDNESTLTTAAQQAEAAGLSADEQKKMVAALTFEQVEKQGQDVDAWWGSLTPAEQEGLRFSPETLRNDMKRTEFLGLAQTLLWVGAGAALAYAGFRGLPTSLAGLADIAILKNKGASAQVIANELSIVRTAVLNKTWIPGSIAGILGAGGWLFGGLMNNLNDATLWGRIFLDQAHDDVMKAAEQAAKKEAGGSGGNNGADLPKTIIRMVKEEKPQQFIGTLFSSKLGSVEHFERVLDDKITDMQDLETDAKLNLNRWLASLPNRMGYSIVIRKDPVDEYGAQQSGIWATLTVFITHISGKTTPIDTILLGPVEPQVRLELAKRTTTIENQLAGFITAAQVKEIQIPSGSVDIFNAEGERVTPSSVSSAPVQAPATAPAITAPPAPKPVVASVNSQGVPLAPAQDASYDFGNMIFGEPNLRSGYLWVYDKQGRAAQHTANSSINSDWSYVRIVPTAIPIIIDNKPIGGAYTFPRTVTVTADALMVRSSPSSSAPLAGSQRLVRGNTFTAIDRVKGEDVSGNSWWWKSSLGNYVWTGGTD